VEPGQGIGFARFRPGCDIQQNGWHLSCDGDGRFTLFGPPEEGPLALIASHAGYGDVEQEIEPAVESRTDYPLSLERRWTIHGRLELPSGLHRRSVRILASGPAADPLPESLDPRAGGRLRVPDEFGRFAFEGCRRGELTLDVRVEGREQSLRIERLTLARPGREEAHLILPDWSLEGAIGVLRLRVRPAIDDDEAGNCRVWCRARPSDEWARVFATRDSDFGIPSDGAAVDVLILWDGHRLFELRELSEDREVILRPAIAARWIVRFESPPPRGLSFGIGLRRVADPSTAWPIDEPPWTIVPPGTTTADFALPLSGDHWVEIGVYPPGAGFPNRIELGEVRVGIRDVDALQSFTIDVSDAALGAALDDRRHP
jgi:hypothetical protein